MPRPRKLDPIRRSCGSTWTDREYRAITQAAEQGWLIDADGNQLRSRAAVIRALLQTDQLAALIARQRAASQ